MSDERIEKAAQAIRDTCERLCTFLLEKNAAYGNSAFEPVGVFCKADAETLIRARLDDKISRLQRGQAAGEDAELDALGYLLLLRALPRYRELCGVAVGVDAASGPDRTAAPIVGTSPEGVRVIAGVHAPGFGSYEVGVRLKEKGAGYGAEIVETRFGGWAGYPLLDTPGFRLAFDDGRSEWASAASITKRFDVEPFEAREPAPGTPSDPGILHMYTVIQPPPGPWQPGVNVVRNGVTTPPLHSAKFSEGDEGSIHAWDNGNVYVRRRADQLVYRFLEEDMSRLFRLAPCLSPSTTEARPLQSSLADPWQPGVEVERIGKDDGPTVGGAARFNAGDLGWVASRESNPFSGGTRVLVRGKRDGLVWGFSIDEMPRLFRVVEPKEGAKP